jgi:hypothetical protein
MGKQKKISDDKKAAGIIANKLTAIAYLKDAGFKISKSTFYRHFAAGKIGPQPDGAFLKADLDTYANKFLKLKDGTLADTDDPAPVVDDALDKKRTWEARKIKAQAKHWEVKAAVLRGEYVERASYERALARRASIFKSDGENFFRVNAGEIINIVKGDPALAPDLIDFCLAQFEAWLHRYSEGAADDLPAQADIKYLSSVDN